MRRGLRLVLPLLVVAAALVHPFGLHKRIGVDTLDLILALFGLLAIDTLVERVSLLESLHDRLTEIASRRAEGGRDPLGELEPAAREIAKLFHAAHTIDICGITLGRTIVTHTETLRQRLERGCKVRICIIDPDASGPAARTAAARSANINSAERMAHHVESTVEGVRALWNTLSKTHRRGLELYYLDYPPPYKIIAVNGSEEHGAVFVELYACKVSPSEDPALLMTNASYTWYRFFVEQARQIIASGRRVPLP